MPTRKCVVLDQVEVTPSTTTVVQTWAHQVCLRAEPVTELPLESVPQAGKLAASVVDVPSYGGAGRLRSALAGCVAARLVAGQQVPHLAGGDVSLS